MHECKKWKVSASLPRKRKKPQLPNKPRFTRGRKYGISGMSRQEKDEGEQPISVSFGEVKLYIRTLSYEDAIEITGVRNIIDNNLETAINCGSCKTHADLSFKP